MNVVLIGTSCYIRSEYSSVKWRGAFVGAVFAMQGIGILMAAAVAAVVAAIFDAAYPATPFPVYPPGCVSWAWQDSGKTISCPPANRQYYYQQILSSCPEQADYVCKCL